MYHMIVQCKRSENKKKLCTWLFCVRFAFYKNFQLLLHNKYCIQNLTALQRAFQLSIPPSQQIGCPPRTLWSITSALKKAPLSLASGYSILEKSAVSMILIAAKCSNSKKIRRMQQASKLMINGLSSDAVSDNGGMFDLR